MNVPSIASFFMAWCFLLLPTAAWAQAGGTGAIAGVVKDTSGAVMPGVTVEAASPALIEKVRTVVTDAQGQYKIVDLRPGSYVVTFSLPGFSTVKREAFELTTAFTATVNAELKVGAVEETITVSGQAPVVDTQNVSQQAILGRATLDALPTSRSIGSYSTLLPGAVLGGQDVGGLAGERTAQFSLHGQRSGDFNMAQDGLSVEMVNGSAYSFNPHNTQEIVLETSGTSAEAQAGGVRMNVVPKDGGNKFSGSFGTFDSHPDLQNENLTDALRARGLTATPSIKELYDVGGSLGGPIKQDRLWFFTAHRKWAASRYFPGLFYNKLAGTVFYEPHPSRPAYSNNYYQDHSLRLTWQASPKDKVAAFYGPQFNCHCFNSLENITMTPEGTAEHHYQPVWTATVTWSRPATSRLLLEAGASAAILDFNAKKIPESGNDISITELSRGLTYGSRVGVPGNSGGYGGTNLSRQINQRFAMSYVTGSHNFKVGLNLRQYSRSHNNHANLDGIIGARSYTFRNQAPVSVTIWATPFGLVSETTTVAPYAQDQWTIQKLTLNLGLRYDYFNGSTPAQHLAAGYFVPARDLPAVKNSPNWKNLSPRLGAAYDLFGNGKTAIKGSLGRYAIGVASGGDFALNDPMRNQPASATRTWDDANRNYVPDCVLGPSVLGANGECGPLSDLAFGQLLAAGSTRYADDALTGFNSQATNWQSSVSLQHQLRPGMALNIGYFRTWYANFRATDNQFVTPADYDSYCITAPVDSRLPSSGQQLCGLYDITPTQFGRVDNLVTLASHYGTQTEVFNGVDATLNARFGQGGQISGGMSTGRTVTDNCLVVDSPQQARPGFCKIGRPWSSATQVKFLVVYPLPWSLQTSAVYQNMPGTPITASYVATNAQIAPSLGRNLGACRGAATCNATATIDLIPPNTVFEDRFQQVDFRVTRIFRVGKVKVQGNFELYNALNASPVLSMTTRYGPQWQNAAEILAGRLFKVGVQLDF